VGVLVVVRGMQVKAVTELLELLVLVEEVVVEQVKVPLGAMLLV
jgi:hypothetical protein